VKGSVLFKYPCKGKVRNSSREDLFLIDETGGSLQWNSFYQRISGIGYSQEIYSTISLSGENIIDGRRGQSFERGEVSLAG
jgi:hypothetical protein